MTDTDRQPGDLLVRGGAVAFAIGAGALLVILGAYFVGDGSPTALNLLALLLPVGLAVALLGLLRGARH